jgi:DNA-binding LacI/PurR family transcriptional regulator
LADAIRITRVQGYVDALTEAGLAVREDYAVGDHATKQSPRYSTDTVGYHAAMELLRRSDRPTAIFARNDHTAFGVIQAARELGLRIPQDLSVVGFDDVPLATEINPALTTIRQPIASQGQKAAEFLLSRIEKPTETQEPRKVILDCEMVVRGSTAAPPSA